MKRKLNSENKPTATESKLFATDSLPVIQCQQGDKFKYVYL